jgi:hypothetical protein
MDFTHMLNNFNVGGISLGEINSADSDPFFSPPVASYSDFALNNPDTLGLGGQYPPTHGHVDYRLDGQNRPQVLSPFNTFQGLPMETPQLLNIDEGDPAASSQSLQRSVPNNTFQIDVFDQHPSVEFGAANRINGQYQCHDLITPGSLETIYLPDIENHTVLGCFENHYSPQPPGERNSPLLRQEVPPQREFSQDGLYLANPSQRMVIFFFFFFLD